MKPFSLFLHVAAPLFLPGCVLAVATIAQAPNASQGATNSAPLPRAYPMPTKLKVLPRGFTGQQVHEIMKQWERSLGVRCDACHSEATEILPADDDSHLNYADDSKPMKVVARTMYKMTEDINNNYVATFDNSGMPVTCGTCHRGRVSPEPYDGLPANVPPQSSATLKSRGTPPSK